MSAPRRSLPLAGRGPGLVAVYTGAWAEAEEAVGRALSSPVGAPPGETEVAAAVAAARRVRDERIGRHLAERRPPIGCSAGCSHCCLQPVATTLPEAALALASLGAEAPAAADRARGAAAAYAGLTHAEAWDLRRPCPLLVGGRCAAYEARPAACAGYYSLDATACAGPADALVPRLGDAAAAAAAADAALVGGLAASGLDVRPVWLAPALAALADDPSLWRRWLTGARLPEALRVGGRFVASGRRGGA